MLCRRHWSSDKCNVVSLSHFHPWVLLSLLFFSVAGRSHFPQPFSLPSGPCLNVCILLKPLPLSVEGRNHLPLLLSFPPGPCIHCHHGFGPIALIVTAVHIEDFALQVAYRRASLLKMVQVSVAASFFLAGNVLYLVLLICAFRLMGTLCTLRQQCSGLFLSQTAQIPIVLPFLTAPLCLQLL